MVILRQHWLFELTALCESLVRGKEQKNYCRRNGYQGSWRLYTAGLVSANQIAACCSRTHAQQREPVGTGLGEGH